jgi:tetratricopeptide (TPR) repeat protein
MNLKRRANQAAQITLCAAVLLCGWAGAAQQDAPPPPPQDNAPQEPPAPATPAAPAESTANAPYPYAEAVRQNNLGVALMDHGRFEDALPKFQLACVMNPQSDVGCLNLGIALLALKHYDDAWQILAKAAERNPQSVPAWFNLGLVERAAGHNDVATEDFEKVAALDPNDANAQYFIGLFQLENKQYNEAIATFKKVIALDPNHVSAEWGLAQAEGQLGDIHGALADLDRAEQIASQNLGSLMNNTYGKQGPHSLAELMLAPPGTAPLSIPVRFLDVTAAAGLPLALPAAKVKPAVGRGAKTGLTLSPEPPEKQSLASFFGSGACVLDYDRDGLPDIFLANADGQGHAALYRNVGHGKFENVTKDASLDMLSGAIGCAVGDYDNDGRNDLAVGTASGIVLYHNEADGTFKDVTDMAGVRTDGLVLGITFADFDHDGNVDLYATRFTDFPLDDPSRPFTFPFDSSASGNILWRNQGNGRFMDWTKTAGLSGSGPSVAALETFVGGAADSAVPDLVVTGWQRSPVVFSSQPKGTFQPKQPWSSEMPGPAAGAVALDFDHDGLIDLAFTHWSSPGLSLWRNKGDGSFERVDLPIPEWMRGWGIAALDYDNDGWVDIVAVGETFADEGRIILLRNEGGGAFRDVTHETGLDRIVLRNPRSVVAFDYDGDGSMDLLITQNNLPPVLLRNVGGNKNNWLQLAASGDPDNKMGIGTRAEIFAGALRQTWIVPAAAGYLGQGVPMIHAGLGDLNEADVVRLRWPSGVLRYEMKVSGGKRAAISEIASR